MTENQKIIIKKPEDFYFKIEDVRNSESNCFHNFEFSHQKNGIAYYECTICGEINEVSR